MPSTTTDFFSLRTRLPLPAGSFVGVIVALLAVAASAFFIYQTLETRRSAADRVSQTLAVIQELEGVLSTLKDAETGQRGYLLTGEERYLEPYLAARTALPGELAAVRALLAGNSEQMRRLDVLEQVSTNFLAELEQLVAIRRDGDVAGAINRIRTDRGKADMDRARALVGELETEERTLLIARQQEWQDAQSVSMQVTLGSSALLILLISGGAFVMSRDFKSRETETWLRTGQAGLSAEMQGEQRLDTLATHVLTFLARYLEAQVGAVYIADGPNRFRRFAAYALPPDLEADVVRPGDGLIGQAARENRPLLVTDVPDGYLHVASGLGRGKPSTLVVAPAAVDRVVHAVVELGFFRRVQPEEVDLLERVSEQIAVAVRGSKDRTRLEELLQEVQRQTEELQTQQEELRVSNEELEEQSQVLKDSHARLETQQAELEQINSQLEEQTEILERQKDDLVRAQADLTVKASELERANQYKSEFLANMSHELRTPLNSSLILAKLLAENKGGNLTEEQVTFAQTIFSAGNDLLALINDILDLSKVEAGKIELNPEAVPIARAVDAIVRSFKPVAEQKGLGLTTTIEPAVPERFETDEQRLGQILKNLLSNAIKFTDTGTVSIRVSSAGGTVSFAVRDTGVGIPPQQQGIIFEAFRQADGSTHRKHGGTGLGLSISRDLARLLGGDVTVQSSPGAGSTFTLTLPLVYQPAAAPLPPPVSPAQLPAPALLAAATVKPASQPIASAANGAATVGPAAFDDDRDHLTPGIRRILVVEDDPRFAMILRDLAHEMNFQCVVTHTAHDGLAAAAHYELNAILLDMNLPDHSGLGVLDQLKRNPATRHLPVHVVSVEDYSQQALERGAIGYALKPVKREQLVEVFQRLEAKLTQGMRRVLVVEDDRRQRESIQELLKSGDVQIVGVATAGEALNLLKTTTFDCMVMDLSLPDLSGYELLQRMAEQEEVSFPPVIVYTGRTLTRDEEQRLGRFSKSIIIKDARSPERLLDEVTLFLHQVESALPEERQRMLKVARDREAALEGRRVLIVEDDARNIFALSNVLEPKGVKIEIARNGREAVEALARSDGPGGQAIDLVLMDIMMPEMDGLTAMREIRKRPELKRVAIIALTAKAMKDDHEKCLAAGANDYIAKPLDVERLLSLVRVWMPK